MAKREFTCASFIVNTDNQLLVLHPTGAKHDFWSVPKGRAEVDESYEWAAQRELYEETGVTTYDLDDALLTKAQLGEEPYGKRRKTLVPFVYFVDESLNNFPFHCEIKPDDNGRPEADGFAWVDFEEAKRILHFTQVRVVKAIEKALCEVNVQFD